MLAGESRGSPFKPGDKPRGSDHARKTTGNRLHPACDDSPCRPASADEKEIERWIDEITQISEPGFGYSVYYSGSEFLPYENTAEPGPFVIGPLTQLVPPQFVRSSKRASCAGPPAKHINDIGTVKMPPVSGICGSTSGTSTTLIDAQEKWFLLG